MAEYDKFLLDILNSTQSIDTNINSFHDADMQWEQQILKAVQDIRGNISQSAARESRDERRRGFQNTGRSSRDGSSNEYRNLSSSSSKKNFSFGNIGDEFKKGLSESVREALGVSDFKKKIGDALGNLAESAGISLKDLPQTFGKEFGKNLMGNFADSKLFGGLFDKLKGGIGGLGDNIANYINSFAPDKPGANLRNDSQSSAQDEATSNLESTYAEYSDREIEILENIRDYVDTIARHWEKMRPSDAEDISADREAERKERERVAAEAEAQRQAERARQQSQSANIPSEESEGEDEPIDSQQIRQMGRDEVRRLGKQGLKKAGGFLRDKVLSKFGFGGAEGAAGAGAEGIAGAGMETAAAEGVGAAGTAGAGATAGGVATVGAGATTATAGSGIAGAASSAAAGGPYAIAAAVAIVVIAEMLKKAIGPAIEGISKFVSSFGKAWNRTESTNKKNLELANERRKKDIEAVIEEPFKILESSMEKIWQSWDENVKVITATQGYSKADLQDLLAKYGERLQSEGLIKYINAADIQGNLAKVLQAGMSGRVAEEFAYIATKLNATIPTQDFFTYAETYSSIAANLISQGKSQSEAISYANKQLELFASNILYASRQLAGGFSTGLKDASNLFASAQQIARAAKTNNPSLIGGVLASVSAIIGAIAPELSSSIVDKVVSAAIGGNESSLVALRSLTGLNASNTQFLSMLAKNPQQIFYQMFSGLARMQNMSNDAYMEVAEGLSSIFGVDMKALASVDFQYLANAIKSMQVGYDALDENTNLLLSGQTTSRKEQMMNEKINQKIIEEGLSYVLDNEVARTVWLNMQEEQRMREMEEASYAVELQGAALELLQGLVQSVTNILNILNPFAWFQKLNNVVQTAIEGAAQEADLWQVLQLGKVGSGNRSEFYNLTTRNQNLMLVEGLATMMGGVSAWRSANSVTQLFNNLTNPSVGSGAGGIFGGGLLGKLKSSVAGGLKSLTPIGMLQNLYDSFTSNSIKSRYDWGTVASKSEATLISAMAKSVSNNVVPEVSEMLKSSSSETKSGNDALRSKVDQLISDSNIRKYIDESKGYDYLVRDVNEAANGISNFEDTLESLGYEVSDIKKKFEDSATEKGVEEEKRRREVEESSWKAQIAVANYLKGDEESLVSEIRDFQSIIVSYINGDEGSLIYDINDNIILIHEGWKTWFTRWEQFVANRQGLGSFTLSRIEELQKSEDSATQEGFAYRLANILTEFNKDDDLKDASVQTNVLLAEILVLLKAAMNEGSRTGGLSLPDTLAALALGIVNRDK